jgi:protoheme ferro-lyase
MPFDGPHEVDRTALLSPRNVRTMTAMPCPAQAAWPIPADHPRGARRKIGVLIANLGTPDGYDYWSMRRYLNEFLSDKRVIDYPAWKWQPLLQTIILTKRPFTSGANYKLIWNTRPTKPADDHHQGTGGGAADRAQALWGDRVMVDFCMRYGNPSTEDVVEAHGQGRLRQDPVLPALSAICRRDLGHRE